MAVDLKEFEKKLAQNKVYDAWQYVNSLRETLGYMNVSFEMLKKVYEHRINTLQEVQQDMFKELAEKHKTSLKVSDLERTNLNIGGYEIDDTIFLRKTTMEFFHYARISMDVLFQIVNAALLGDDSIAVDDKGILRKLLTALGRKPEFTNLLNIMDNNKNNPLYQYLMAFDNYMKHIKTILITVNNSIMFGNDNSFIISEFVYDGERYVQEEALDKVEKIHNEVLKMIDDTLAEILVQIPNCVNNSDRIQELHYKQVFIEKDGKNDMYYTSFFIDVQNDLSELPSEIKVYPLIVKPNDEVYSCDFKFDTIFIRKAGTEESDIIGIATLKNGIDTNEFYRVFDVKSCTMHDYHMYLFKFKQNYANMNIKFNAYAMDGSMIFAKD